MGRALAAVLGVAGIAVIGLIFIVATYVSYSNREVRLRNSVNAKIEERDVVFDNTWKIIQQQAQVADKYQASFREIFASLMSERYKEGEAQLAKIVQEANPNFEPRLFEKLMDSIEEQRNIFTAKQQALIDLNREHTDLLTTFPGNILLFNRDVIKLVNITSDRTREASRTGVDNDTQMFTPTPTPSPTASPTPVAKRATPNQNGQMPIVIAPPSR